jgi:uncharacterized protein (TIGR02646 family)
MRPVERGVAPAVYAKYQDAGPDLQAAIGDYCSYCERQIETHLAVEHIQPKSLVTALATQWSNFLLGCVNCNSCKGDTPINLPDYLWPDADNTLRAIEYKVGGIVSVKMPNPTHIQTKAKNTIELVGLDKDPGNPDIARRPSDKDKRWKRRFEAWQLAVRYREKIRECERLAPDVTISDHVRSSAVDVALGRGMFSIWWTVFDGDTDMRRRLREAFVGTHSGSFDVNEELVARPLGQV